MKYRVIEDVRDDPNVQYSMVKSYEIISYADPRPLVPCTFCGVKLPHNQLTLEKIHHKLHPKGHLLVRCPSCTMKRL